MKGLLIFSKYTIWFSIFGIPVLYFALQYVWLLFANTLWTTPYQLFFDLSLLSVFFVMMIRPLADIFHKQKILKKLIILRKPLGILSVMIIVTIMVSNWILNPDLAFFNYFSADKWRIGYPIIARISEITAIILLATSNNYSIKKLGWKNWKRVQKLAYPYFFAWAIIAARWNHTEIVYAMIAAVIIAWVAAEVLKMQRKKKPVT